MAIPDPELVSHLRARVVREQRIPSGHPDPSALRLAVEELLEEERRMLSPAQRDALLDAVNDEALGLGPIAPLLRDPSVTEVMINGPDRVFVERAGRLEPTDVRFAGTAHLTNVIDRILGAVDRRVDEASPMVDARLHDGSRVNVVIGPLAVDGPAVTIRRFSAAPLTLDRLIELGTLDEPVAALLRSAVAKRRSIVITGGTGSGKTTTLAAIASLLDEHERVVTIEDAAELRLDHPHVVRLEARPASIEGRGAVTIRALVRNALRMRPDRIIVGEVRGGEALDLLQAMTTGHDGSLSTLHASSAADGMRRLVMLALMGDVDLPYRAIADQVGSAIDLVVHQARDATGQRRIVEVAAVEPWDGGPRTRPLVRWLESSADHGTWHCAPDLERWPSERADRGESP